MKAVRIHEYGDINVLKYEDAPIPEIAPDELLVKIAAASVNPVDWKVRKGNHGNLQFPFILGWDLAGTVEKKGALVTRFSVGDEVFARANTQRNGSYAEYIAVRSAEVAFMPSNASMQQAAAIPLACQTAWDGLFEQGLLKAGQRVLIHGGSGGVGNFAIQLAKLAGAHVITTTSEKNKDLVTSLGADEVIDYKSEDFSQKLSGLDLVFDTMGGETQKKSFGIIKKGGILVSTVGADAEAAKQHNVIAKSFMVDSNGARLQEIAGLYEQGKLKVIIAKEFPLSAIREAHKLSEEGHVAGKIVINIAE